MDKFAVYKHQFSLPSGAVARRQLIVLLNEITVDMIKEFLQNYADIWLFLSMHFICSLRMTDFEWIYHPTLPKDTKTVLSETENRTFADKDARKVLLTNVWL